MPVCGLRFFIALQDVESITAQVFYFKGLAEYYLGNFDIATQHFEKSKSLDPSNLVATQSLERIK
jgi:tetratricopeptide (TPR) repeat protein